MKPKLLVLRPEPGNAATAAKAAALGWDPVRAPLFTVTAVDWLPPDPSAFDAVLLTSANAARHAGGALALFTGLPAYAVGRATAEAARQASFGEIRCGSKDAEALVVQAKADGIGTMLHLAGREHHAPSAAGITVERRIVYAAEPVDRLPQAAKRAASESAIALLHSPRAAALFAALFDAAEVPRATLAIAAISPAALAAAGGGWRMAVAASVPDDDALLAAAARLCK